MNDTTNAPTDNAVVTEAPAQTLESIAKEIPVEQQANQFTAVPEQRPAPQQYVQPQQPYIPDPITDPDGYKRLISQQMASTHQLGGLVRDVSSKLAEYQQREIEAKVNAEVNDVVSKIQAKVNLDPDLVEAALNVTYKKDANFKHIWDNRKKNPQALEKAIGVITNQMQSKYQVRQDPQLAENVRAAKSSQQSTATRQPESGFSNDSREFAKQWADLVAGRTGG